ncbi:hypothetical protein [uncultured Ruegeria sp.]|uniref:hypothetical protein n=1 Tax=uncultured Ruegeria sp. TaxID=259304 RepID=UPI002623168D|nr:hypothetical protein [uncultured Ruegeria sp.]
MTNSKTGNYSHLQPEVVAIQSLISAAMAVQAAEDDCSQTMTILEMAYERARNLNARFDIVKARFEAAS